jgi:hypothetical protein
MQKIFNETTPLDEILKALPQNEIDELSALGDTRDDTRWQIGDIARRWIDDNDMPVTQICKIIGKLTDYGHERVRQLLYNSRYYHEHPELRQRYLNLRYSIFEYARSCDDPEKVLQSALESNLSVNQVKFTYLPLWDEIKDVYTRIPKRHEAEASTIIKTALGKLRELMEK